MTQQRACDVCRMYRQHLDGSPAVLRYGLSRQIAVPGERPGRPGGQAFKRVHRLGGIDMCDQCWERIAQPKMRPRKSP